MSKFVSYLKEHGKYTFAVVVLMFVFVFAVMVILVYGSILAYSDGVARGVMIGDTDVSEKDREEVYKIAKNKFDLPVDGKIPFVCGDTCFEIRYDEIGFSANIDKMAEQALSVAREGSFFRRTKEALVSRFAKKYIEPEYACDSTSLIKAINERLADKVYPITPYRAERGEDKLIITNSAPGFGIKNKDIVSEIVFNIKSENCDKQIEIILGELEAQPVDIEDLCKLYPTKPKDASYREKDGKYFFEQEIYGVNFDKELAQSIICSNKSNPDPYFIPATVIKPEVTLGELKEKLCTDCLGSFSTDYRSSDEGRASNVELSAYKLNGVVLNPDERFSYNRTIGPRTLTAGFKIARVYEGDSIVDGVGGGICQVSSTLYNAVLFADLNIVSRTNHSMPVAYVPFGRDATVSWGTIDFVFENNRKYPVRLAASCENKVLSVSVYGVREDDTTIEIVTEQIGTIAYTTKEIPDTGLKQGEYKVIKEGSNGLVVDTYKVYRKNGVITDKKHISKSTYIPVARQVRVGTGQAYINQTSVSASAPPVHSEEAPSEEQLQSPENGE